MKCLLSKKSKNPKRVIHAPVKEPREEIPTLFKQCAIDITSSFEGTTWGTCSPNFDGQGVSVGKFQWNYGQQSLQSKILIPFINMFGTKELDSFFPEPISHSAQMNSKAAVAFSLRMQSRKLSVRSMKYIYSMKPEWSSAWEIFLNDKRTIEIQVDASSSMLSKSWSYIEEYNLPPDMLHFTFCFDVVVQNGGFKGVPYPHITASLNSKYQAFLNDKTLTDNRNYNIWKQTTDLSDRQKNLYVWISSRVTRNKWAKDVMSRKGTISHQKGIVHGKSLVIGERPHI